MNAPSVQYPKGITLAGGARFGRALLDQALARAPHLVAADSGADRLLALGARPEAVFGDLDSISDAARETIGAARLFPIPEQVTTDFDKALRSVAAPFVLAVGVLGGRLDHGLAVLNALIRHPERRVLVLSTRDVVFHAPAELSLSLRPGDRLSLFPLAPVRGRAEGLEWPLDGLDFAPDGMIGTSNRVLSPEVRLWTTGPGMLVILPRARLDAALAGLVPGYAAP